jgi:hypothetical protein
LKLESIQGNGMKSCEEWQMTALLERLLYDKLYYIRRSLDE